MITRPTRSRLMAAGSLVVAGALVLSACSSSKKAAPKKPTTTTTAMALCPLTGAQAPNNQVPQRTALAVKIDNYQSARPQSGLDFTDMVFEEPVEGGITRYVAVFQCQNASSIGPVRSARNIDVGILGQLGNPPEVHVGGINPVISDIVAAGIPNLDLGNNAASAATHPAGRYAPYDTYTSTAALYALVPNLTTPPTPIYAYTPDPIAGGLAVTSVHVPFSGQSDVTWNWNPATGTWLRFYNGTQPDNNADGVQNQAANVIVQTVHVTYGPWLENSEGGLEVQAQLYGTSGPAQVYRNGVQLTGTWSRSAINAPTVYKTTSGKTITMAPGRTWIELLPDTQTATATPAPTTTTTKAVTTTTKKK
jgi:Protein of unknown function (DUF3048) N-terminal domain/Protein of unknown function (DUF3048) C-terminal domain